ncbi:metallophosphoesterase family protein [Jongsikchunia kroppenstedtii]|uniref:metallophosphoesterase family protein n=1 Tax=Jongsikchunia kroppenstedtii TaxID=1121721 RepID=UPI000368F732|nr:metallophosphoesterase [Jongsikchunia kroppenstedtii]
MWLTQHHTAPSGAFLRTPDRVAIAGDWHANTQYGRMAVHHARKRNADVLIHLGDFGFNFTDKFLDGLQEALNDDELILGFVEGNHENYDWLLEQPVADDGLRHLRERIVHLPRGFRWRWGGTACLAVGGAYSLDRALRIPGTTWWPQEILRDEEVDAIAAAGVTDAMFCHDCPAGVTIPELARDRFGFPDEDVQGADRCRATLRRLVDQVQPNRLWHGHYHRRYQFVLDADGYRTVIDGLGRDKQPIDNNMVVIPMAALGTHRATRIAV